MTVGSVSVVCQRRPVMPDDLFRCAFVQDPQMSPDGRNVAYVVERLFGDELRYRGQIFVMPVDGGEPYAVTSEDEHALSPYWSPDGNKLGFLMRHTDDEKMQVYTVSAQGGGAERAASLPGGIADFAWAPEGQSMVLAAAGVEPSDSLATLRVTRLHYKGDGVGLLLGERSHLWLADLRNDDEPRQLTNEDEDDGSASFSPDGRWLAFTRTRPSDAGDAPFNDIWVLDVESGVERNLTNGRGPAFRPSWSPDSKMLAFAHHTEPNDIWWGANYKIWTVEIDNGVLNEATAGFDELCARAVSSNPSRGISWPGAQWSADGESLYFLATVGGAVNVYRVSAGGGEVQAVTEGAQVVTGFALSDERVVHAVTTTTSLPDLWSVTVTNGEPKRLTDVSAPLFAEITPSPVERFRFKSFDGLKIEAWLMQPTGLKAADGKQYPMVLHIHGGPHGAYGEAYSHSWQALAGAGYFVLYANPRGSQGYGEEFAKRCIGDWGGGDYKDLLAAVDHIVARGYIDNTRVGVWGASYGGYMTSWIAGHTDRFAAIVSDVPVTNLLSFYGTSDIGHYFAPFEMGVQPWEDPQKYLFHSPISYAKDVVTPLLLTHREDDMRCPISQSEEFYTQLKALGKTVEFLRIADASHGIVPPARGHVEHIHLDAALDWFGKHMPSTGESHHLDRESEPV